jgi:hypothetical protein
MGHVEENVVTTTLDTQTNHEVVGSSRRACPSVCGHVNFFNSSKNNTITKSFDSKTNIRVHNFSGLFKITFQIHSFNPNLIFIYVRIQISLQKIMQISPVQCIIIHKIFYTLVFTWHNSMN